MFTFFHTASYIEQGLRAMGISNPKLEGLDLQVPRSLLVSLGLTPCHIKQHVKTLSNMYARPMEQ